MITSDFTTKDIQRFWSKVNIPDDPDACWEWQAGKDKDGYGQITVGSMKTGSRRHEQSHRISYEFEYGEIPNGLLICHHCDNPKCVNPKHLFAGTNQDNMTDKVKKGRARGGSRCGEKHVSAKLTWKIVEEIRARYANGGITQKTISEEYNIGRSTVAHIIGFRRWQKMGNSGE